MAGELKVLGSYGNRFLISLAISFVTASPSWALDAKTVKKTPQQANVRELLHQEANSGKKVFISLILHAEGWEDSVNLADSPDGTEEGLKVLKVNLFKQHAEALQEFIDIADDYGAKLTIEATQSFVKVQNSLGWTLLQDAVANGHGVGAHMNLDQAATMPEAVADLNASVLEFGRAGLQVRHASGTCSSLDWVSAIAAAGLEASTCMVGYCLKSYPSAVSLPLLPTAYREIYRECADPSACHQTVPFEVSARSHPWFAHDGSDWLSPATSGTILVPSHGLLPCLKETEASPYESATHCDYDMRDNKAALKLLEEVYLNRAPGTLSTYTFVYSVGKAISSVSRGEKTLRSLFSAIRAMEADGKVEWKTVGQMINLQNNL